MYSPFSTGSHSVLSFNDLRLQVHLGVPDDERAVRQEISISFQLYYDFPPASCKSDSPYGMTCYGEMSEQIKMLCHSREFKTIEFLAYFLYENLKTQMEENVKLRVCVEKCKPPVEGMRGSTSFECGDDVNDTRER